MLYKVRILLYMYIIEYNVLKSCYANLSSGGSGCGNRWGAHPGNENDMVKGNRVDPHEKLIKQ